MAKLKHKYNAKPTTIDDIKFGSRKEGRYYQDLKLRQMSGEILFFLRQVPIRLPGGIKYVIDFLEFHAPKNGDQGDVVFTEVKGMMTPLARVKIKQAEEILGITINIV